MNSNLWQSLLLWGGVAVTFTALLLIVAPGRGASWGDDDQLFLAMSWEAAKGYGLNLQLPQQPSYLVDALLMKAGMHEVLHFRYVNYLISLMTSALFFMGMDRRRWRSPVTPLAIMSSILISLNSVENPNALSLAFFLAGAGLTFFALDADRRIARTTLHLAAGCVFAIAGFMHAAVAIAMLIVVAVIALATRPRPHLVLLCYMIVSVILWSVYLDKLGPSHMLAGPAGHKASIGYLAFRCTLIGIFYLEATLAFLAVAALSSRPRVVRAHLALIGAVTLFYGASLAAYVFHLPLPYPFPLHGMFLLSSEGQWISRVIGGFSFYVMLFTSLRWLAGGWSDSVWEGDGGWVARAKAAYFQSITRLWQNDAARKITIAVLGMALLQASLAAGSNTSISQGMVYLAGPVFGLGLMVWERLPQSVKERRLIYPAFAAVWLICCGLFAFTYNHASGEAIFAPNRVILGFDNLHGILETPRYRDSTARLSAIYKASGCDDKPFLPLIYLPGLYYMFHHPYPLDLGVIRPAMGFPESRLREILTLRKGWCVLDASEKEIELSIGKTGADPREGLRRFLAANSTKVFIIPSPASGLSPMQLYVRQPLAEPRNR